jgi:hypothetical protein
MVAGGSGEWNPLNMNGRPEFIDIQTVLSQTCVKIRARRKAVLESKPINRILRSGHTLVFWGFATASAREDAADFLGRNGES